VHFSSPLVVATLSVLVASSVANAGFSGQPLLGPITLNSVVTGNTTGAADDNDGFTSGDHFFDIWPGPDDVWQLNWPGGDMEVRLTYDNAVDDLDLFLYEPGSLDDSGNYAIANTGTEIIAAPASPAGTYYLNIDSDTAAHAGPYTLSVSTLIVPEPTSLAAISALSVALRRRRLQH
jgi:hypothetical protein